MAKQNPPSCQYTAAVGSPCPGRAQGKRGLCFWHDPSAPKTGPGLAKRLEAWAAEGHSMEGFILKGAHLRDVDLNQGDTRKSVNLTHADLSRADLRGAHLFNIDLRSSNLFKADLEDANLNHARLSGANLLGVDLHDTKLESVDWGNGVIQELQAMAASRQGRHQQARELYQEAEEIYRNLSRVCEEKGHFGASGRFFYGEMVMRRMGMPRWSRGRLVSKAMDLICGYGELPGRVILFSLTIIVFSALLYLMIGVRGEEGEIVFHSGVAFYTNLHTFLTCLYYSVVTFTTLGYGDIVPLGAARAVAAGEAFIGAFTIGLFLVVFVKKVAR